MRLPVFAAALGVCWLTACASHDGGSSAVEKANRQYPYDKPLTSLGGKFGMMPMAAQNTVRAEAGTVEIADVVKGSTAERVFYKVSFKDSKDYPPMYVAPDGTLLKPDLTVAVPAPELGTSSSVSGQVTTVTLNDLPSNVTKVLSEQASDAEITALNKEIWGNHVVYIVSFKDEARHPKLYIMGEGAVLHPTQ